MTLLNTDTTAPWARGDNSSPIIDTIIPEICDFEVEVAPAYYYPAPGAEPVLASGSNVIIRTDDGTMLGTCGDAYVPHQNKDWWDTLVEYTVQTGGVIERAGIYGGSYSWACVKHDAYEVITGDPITKFDMFINPFVAGKSVMIINTDLRAVCGNALSRILKTNENVWRVRHSVGVIDRVRSAAEASKVALAARKEQVAYLTHLAGINVNDAQMLEAGETLFGITDASGPQAHARHDMFQYLLQSGLGTDIPGVRGTAYGFFQAGLEYADHYLKTEDKVQSLVQGTNHKFKQKLNKVMLQLVA